MIPKIETRAWLATYQSLVEIADSPDAAEGARQAASEVVNVCDDAWQAVAGVIRSADYSADASDAAEAMTAAILWYLLESNPSLRALIPAEAMPAKVAT